MLLLKICYSNQSIQILAAIEEFTQHLRGRFLGILGGILSRLFREFANAGVFGVFFLFSRLLVFLLRDVDVHIRVIQFIFPCFGFGGRSSF